MGRNIEAELAQAHELIEDLIRRIHAVPDLDKKGHGLVDIDDVLRVLRTESLPSVPAWQTELPGPGKWRVSLHPARRLGKPAVLTVLIDGLGFVHVGARRRVLGKLGEEVFEGAKWQRREMPQDPFAEREG